MMVRWSGDIQVIVSKMSVNVKSQSELDVGGRETGLRVFLAFLEQHILEEHKILHLVFL